MSSSPSQSRSQATPSMQERVLWTSSRSTARGVASSSRRNNTSVVTVQRRVTPAPAAAADEPTTTSVTPSSSEVVINSAAASGTTTSTFVEKCKEAAKRKQGKIIADSTLRNYTSKLNQVTKFFADHVPDALDEEGKIKVPIDTDHLNTFLGSLVINEDDTHNPSTTASSSSAAAAPPPSLNARKNGNRKSPMKPDTLGGYGSAISYLYRQHGISTGLQDNCATDFIRGSRRDYQHRKKKGVIETEEGKLPLSFELYHFIAREALESCKQLHILYPHLFAILSWNLLARVNNVGDLKLEHITWNGDALFVTLPQTKGDQDGKAVYPRNVYANPLAPEICPVLALAVQIVCMGVRSDEYCNTVVVDGEDDAREEVEDVEEIFASLPLFGSGATCGNFSDWLRKLLSEDGKHKRKRTDHDDNNLLYGTHSFRKGGASFASNFPGGPSMASIFLRGAAWTLGNVPHRYIFAGDGGDQFVGRILSGLPFTSTDFTILPPHFPIDFVIEPDILSLYIPNYQRMKGGFKKCLPFLIASLDHLVSKIMHTQTVD